MTMTTPGWELEGPATGADPTSALATNWVAALALGLAVSAHDDEVAVDELIAASGRSVTVLNAASDRVRLVDTVDDQGVRRAGRLLEQALDRVAPSRPRPETTR